MTAPTRPSLPPELRDTAQPFHAHLDECARCREQPFNLCTRGAALLRICATTPPETPANER